MVTWKRFSVTLYALHCLVTTGVECLLRGTDWVYMYNWGCLKDTSKHTKDRAIDHADIFLEVSHSVLGQMLSLFQISTFSACNSRSRSQNVLQNFPPKHSLLNVTKKFNRNAALQTQTHTKPAPYSLCCMLPAFNLSFRYLLQILILWLFIAYVYRKGSCSWLGILTFWHRNLAFKF
jgi:hypothetical protein